MDESSKRGRLLKSRNFGLTILVLGLSSMEKKGH